MKTIKKIIRRLISTFREKPLTEEQMSQLIISRIRAGGGSVGENVDILSSTIDLGEPYMISIGDNVTLTTMRLLTHDASTKKALGYTKVGRVDIGSDVFVGAGCIILPNTRIGNKVIVGAGSIVASDIPDNSVACGSPCRVVCTYDEYMSRMKTRMNNSVCYNLFPSDLLNSEHQQERTSLEKIGYGFLR